MSSEPPADTERRRRAIWAGAITFGLVSIPVKLYSAVARKDVRFRELHDADGARLREERVCSVDGARVPWEHVAKGYEIAPDRYVMVRREELARLDPKATKTIDIEDFVALADIDPIYYGTTYHVVPDAGGERSYHLLAFAMERRSRVAIGRVVMRSKQYLAAIRPFGRGLCLATLQYADEIIGRGELPEPNAALEAPRERELYLAEQLIESLSVRFQPERYRDDYREKLLAWLDHKARGEALPALPEEAAPAEPPELVEALEASVAAAARRTSPAAAPGARAANDVPESAPRPLPERKRAG